MSKGKLTRDEVVQAYSDFMSDILLNPAMQQEARESRRELASLIGRIGSLGSDAYYNLIYSQEHPEVTPRQFALIQVCAIAQHDYASGENSIGMI